MGREWETRIQENKHEEINDFLRRKEITGRSPRTLNAYSRILRKFYHEQFPQLTPGETQVYHIEEYVARLAERGLAQNTKRRYLESLSAFFSYAMKRPRFENITGNPAAVVLEEIPKQIHDRPDCATWENGKEIIHNIHDPRNKTIAIILAKTGCRLTEALEIKMDDLMLEEGYIRLRKRKGGKQTVVPIDDETIQAIQRFQFTRKKHASDYLFISIRGDRVSRERLRRSIRKAAVQAEVMDQGETRFHRKFTPHTYRTVFTTLMRNQGMPNHILRYLRGDSNDETMDIYTRVDRTQARQHYLKAIKPLHL